MLQHSSSLALRALLKSAAARAGLDRPAALAGLSPAAVAFHVAVVAQDTPVVLVVPADAQAEQAAEDARFFLAVLQGLDAAAAEQAVRPLPSLQVDPYRGLSPHLAVASARARAFHALAAGRARLVVASAGALLPRLSSPDRLAAAGLSLSAGDDVAPRDLAVRLAAAGFSAADPVDAHGEFCVRGGVLDVYPASESQPIRLEFLGDTIESIRRYDAATQRSLEALDRVEIAPQRELLPASNVDDDAGETDRSATAVDYFRRAGATVIVHELDEVQRQARRLEDQWAASAADLRQRGRQVPADGALAVGWAEVAGWLASARRLTELAIDDGAPGRHVACTPALSYQGRVAEWVEEVRAARAREDAVLFVAASPGRAERTIELLADYDVRARPVAAADDLQRAAVLVATGRLSRGFHLRDAGLAIFAETDLFEEERRPAERRKSASRAFLSDFRDLKGGDLVVHVDHGIGRFVGLKKIAAGPGLEAQEFMELRYAGDDKLFVPIERLDLVQKYSGGAAPALDKLGGTTWEKAKSRVKKAMRDMAEELLKLYAARKAVAGHAFSPDAHWHREFGDAFEYELTADQQSAIADIARDLESPTPMDRLLCGDVGFGKTEVAMRAAFKVVMDGKQVAVLAPTTVLAFQHFRTLQSRFAGFPVRIEMISRFRTRQEQQAALADLRSGRVDIMVGTHRLLSKDVAFRDLGLLVVDEEQRFGVTHKERLKQLRKKVDVLTMTATPIPRTLNMSLAGIRDMSVIETPPLDRLAIQTHVVKFDTDVVARAIRTELERDGQAFVVHNRIESIHSIASLVQRLVPEARVAIGHGRMHEDALERVMLDFVAHKFDVLVATTIVENGLDIPNANTIIINRADRYGLAQLYQLRGRVGRSDRPAYAYLLIPAEQSLSPVARRRLAAIREFSDLGSGFRIAALDLEIRGAGNLLGGEQSGHIEAVGFDMYMKLLDDTVRELKGEDLEDERRAAVNLRLDLRIDDAYIPDMNQRLAAYRRLATARSLEDVEAFLAELRDRYGAPPMSVDRLAEHSRIRLKAERVWLESIDREGPVLVLKFRPDARLDPAMVLGLVERRGDLTLLPPALLRLDLRAPADRPPGPADPPRGRQPGRLVRPEPAASRSRESHRAAVPQAEASWWTARASADVAPGFTRSGILAETPLDPSSPDGLFERLGTVLDQLNRALAPHSID